MYIYLGHNWTIVVHIWTANHWCARTLISDLFVWTSVPDYWSVYDRQREWWVLLNSYGWLPKTATLLLCWLLYCLFCLYLDLCYIFLSIIDISSFSDDLICLYSFMFLYFVYKLCFCTCCLLCIIGAYVLIPTLLRRRRIVKRFKHLSELMNPSGVPEMASELSESAQERSIS